MIFRLIHLSDLHFGSILGTAPLQPPANWVPSIGLDTADPYAVQQLASSILSNQNDDWLAVMTGDLTTYGSDSAFRLANSFLRDAPSIRPLKYAIDCPDTPIIPGNHDVWGGSLWGASNWQSAEIVRDNHFGDPCGNAPGFHVQRLMSPKHFPYLVTPTSILPLDIYCLDSTQVDGPNFPGQWPILPHLPATGYVEAAQLDAIEYHIKAQSDERRIRIAAIHHPLAYSETTGTPRSTHALHNLEEVLRRLQNHGFSFVLCGHQHHGFVRPMSAINTDRPPVYVLSTGTATQRVPYRLTVAPGRSIPTSTSPPSEQSNQYRSYDFEQAGKDKFIVKIRCYILQPTNNKIQFAENKSDEVTLTIDLSDYMV